jgi:hypothetical protein
MKGRLGENAVDGNVYISRSVSLNKTHNVVPEKKMNQFLLWYKSIV